MPKRHYVLAIASFLLIPAISVSGLMLFNAIHPEAAPGHANIGRNDWLSSFLVATLLVSMGLWFLTCFFLLKSKEQPNDWLPLALLGPFGLIGLTLLGDKAPAQGDWYQQSIPTLKIPLRIAYELCLFAFVWAAAYQTMVFKRDLMIMYQAAVTGTSTAQIVRQQSASGGMWAFGEGLEILYLVVLFYLLWPVCFNVVRRQFKPRAASESRR